MLLVLNEDQQLLAKTAREVVFATTPLSRVRKLRDTRDRRGFSPEVWRQMVELGWTAIPFTHEQGGADLGVTELSLVTEAMGRRLAPEPLLSSVVLGGTLIARGNNAAIVEQWLPSIISGEKIVTLAHQETGSRHDPFRVVTRAERHGAGFILDGDKAHVLDGFGADAYVVAARTAAGESDRHGITLFFVPAETPRVSCVPEHRVDSRNAALVRLDGVELGQSAVVGSVDHGADLLEQALDRGTVALCGEMLGGMSEAFERTLSYLKERVQFGVVIGSFQALKHRAARMFIEIELSRSATMAAARAIDSGHPHARALVSVAKARCNDAYLLIANEAIQMHGGIGMTDEHEIGFFLKRARVAEMTFGDSAYHRDRFARLSGF